MGIDFSRFLSDTMSGARGAGMINAGNIASFSPLKTGSSNWLNNLLGGIGDSFNTSKNGVGNGWHALNFAGNLWNGYNQQRMAKKNFKLQEDAYNFNKYLTMNEENRRRKMEKNLKDVWE